MSKGKSKAAIAMSTTLNGDKKKKKKKSSMKVSNMLLDKTKKKQNTVQLGQLSVYDQLKKMRKQNKRLTKENTALKQAAESATVAVVSTDNLIPKPRGEVGRVSKTGRPGKKNKEGYCLQDELGLRSKRGLYLRIRVRPLFIVPKYTELFSSHLSGNPCIHSHLRALK